MAITCPQCGRGYDVTLFQFDHRVRCLCGAEVAFPGGELRSGHVRSDSPLYRAREGAARFQRRNDAFPPA